MHDTSLAAQAGLRDGTVVTIRPLRAEDGQPLGTFFVGLSAETQRRYAPHPFDRETAAQLCSSIGADPRTRFIVVLEQDVEAPLIIGYLILTPGVSETERQRNAGYLDGVPCAAIAPAVADAYQGQGVGQLMARHVIACAKGMGLQRLYLSGGVRAFNESGIAFYQRLGFRRVGEFWTNDPDLNLNYAMVLDL
jgi:ribosomal protein S18 acetylase RimI-like enzyme